MVFDGNTSSNATSDVFNISADIVSFTLTDRTGSGVTASIGIFYGSALTYILYNESIAAGESYVYPGNIIRIQKDHQLYINVSGSCDYYFTIV